MPQEEIEQIKQTLLKESSNPNSQQNDQKPAVNENDSAEATTSESESEKKPEKKDRILGLDALLQARKNLLSVVSQQLSTPFDVSLNGIESGDIEAVLKARWPHDQVFLLFWAAQIFGKFPRYPGHHPYQSVLSYIFLD